MKFDELGAMEPSDFERLIGTCYNQLGLSVFLTKRTRDGGVDVITESHIPELGDWIRYAVSIKRFDKPASVQYVRELQGILPLWKADKGILVCLGGFTEPAEKEAKSLGILLEGKKELKKSLELSKLLTPEGDIIEITDPNLEGNRRRSIIDYLFLNRPDIQSIQQIIMYLRRDYGISVSDTVILEDLEKLSKDGYILKLSLGFHYRLSLVDIRNAKEFVATETLKWDYFFKESDVVSAFCREMKIAQEVGKLYLTGIIEIELMKLCKAGLLRKVAEFYSSLRGIEAFQSIVMSIEDIENKLINVIGVNKNEYEKRLKDVWSFEKPLIIPLIDKNGKKVSPFVNLMILKCNKCGFLHCQLVDLIPLIVYPSTFEGKLEVEYNSEKYGTRSIPIEKINQIMEFSRFFVERVVLLSKKYISGAGEIISIRPGVFIITVSIDAKEDTKIGDLIVEIVEKSKRFQNFFSEVYSQIEEFGAPRLFSVPQINTIRQEIETVES